MRTRLSSVVALVSLVAALALSGTAAGIVGGTPDTTTPYRYPSVGLIEIYGFFGPMWAPACTGTLITPNVVLTAGHCTVPSTVGLIAPSDVRVTFDPAPRTILFPDRPPSLHFSVAASFTYPEYLASTPPNGNSKAGYGRVSDVGVLVLADAVPAAVATPMPVVGASALDGIKGASVEAAGYGYNGFSQGAWGTPKAIPDISGLRTYAGATVLTDHDTASRLYLKTSSATCFGDSGAPIVLDHAVAAVAAFAESRSCNSPDYSTRLDTAGVQAFLASFLGET